MPCGWGTKCFLGYETTRARTWSLPKGSHVGLFGDWEGLLLRDYSILPKKELHRRVWVDSLRVYRTHFIAYLTVYDLIGEVVKTYMTRGRLHVQPVL